MPMERLSQVFPEFPPITPTQAQTKQRPQYVHQAMIELDQVVSVVEQALH